MQSDGRNLSREEPEDRSLVRKWRDAVARQSSKVLRVFGDRRYRRARGDHNNQRDSVGHVGSDGTANESATQVACRDNKTHFQKASKGTVADVPTKIVNPEKFRKILYTTPRNRRVEIEVEASVPISVYAVASDDVDNFRNGDDYEGLGFEPTRKLNTEIRLPFNSGDEWYLILENDSSKPAAVHYEVYDS